MFNITRKEINWGGRPLVIETGKIARQADGAVLVTYGETQVLCTAVANRSARPGQDFFPLTVNYQEKTFAAGKIPGGFFQARRTPFREGDVNLAPNRSADSAVVPRGIPERNTSHMHCSGA
jgi:polyribonucleotide nucleotidyltransferase